MRARTFLVIASAGAFLAVLTVWMTTPMFVAKQNLATVPNEQAVAIQPSHLGLVGKTFVVENNTEVYKAPPTQDSLFIVKKSSTTPGEPPVVILCKPTSSSPLRGVKNLSPSISYLIVDLEMSKRQCADERATLLTSTQQ